MKAIDLFAGCGGLSKGFLDAGFNVVLGVDNNDTALSTFELNHDGSIVANLNLFLDESIMVIHELLKKNGYDEIDVIIAGPPCQGFSLTGPRNFDDERNKLYLSVIEAVKYFRPKAFVIENVPGMATLYKGKVKEEVINRLSQLGYNVNSQILNSADYGVPQIRKRLFFVGVLSEYGEFEFPEKVIVHEKNYITTSEAISDLPSLEDGKWDNIMAYESAPMNLYQATMRLKSSDIYNHIGTNHTDHVIDVISQVPEGGNYKDLPPGVGTSRKFNEAWTRYHSERPSRTIDTGHRNHFHYKYNRVPTVRENARLQSFPDDFVFLGNKTEQYRQVGNAVPPLLGYYIGLKLQELLESKIDKYN